MARKKGGSNLDKIKREEGDLEAILSSLPDNPLAWGVVIRLVAPILARLAIRYALKKLDRGMSEANVNAAARAVSDHIGAIIGRRTDKG